MAHLCLILAGLCQRYDIQNAVALPGENIPELWRNFLYREFVIPEHPLLRSIFSNVLIRRSPLIFSLLQGRTRWFGVSPRTPEQIAALPEDWADLYMQSPIGFFRLSEVDEADAPDSPEQRMASEIFFSFHHSARSRIDILLRYLKRFFCIPTHQFLNSEKD